MYGDDRDKIQVYILKRILVNPGTMGFSWMITVQSYHRVVLSNNSGDQRDLKRPTFKFFVTDFI